MSHPLSAANHCTVLYSVEVYVLEIFISVRILLNNSQDTLVETFTFKLIASFISTSVSSEMNPFARRAVAIARESCDKPYTIFSEQITNV